MKDNILLIPTPATVSIYTDSSVLVERICQVTKREYSFTVPLENYKMWRGGMLMQDAFPYLTLDQREILMTGWTPEEWNLLFND
tara:strand:- start:46 stop:297 length:252 start_codon:yes stop_codon:yes gene_type:complete